VYNQCACGHDFNIKPPVARYLLSATITDSTTTTWVTAFNDQAQGLLGGNSADYLKSIATDPSQYDQVLGRFNFQQYNFRLRAKMETERPGFGGGDGGGGEARVRCHVMDAKPLVFRTESTILLDEIAKLEAGKPV